ncbi:MAG: hypothetical protein WDK96_03665 [Candidatus Paceibacterota bacterium]|jgi:hypothetical protein
MKTRKIIILVLTIISVGYSLWFCISNFLLNGNPLLVTPILIPCWVCMVGVSLLGVLIGRLETENSRNNIGGLSIFLFFTCALIIAEVIVILNDKNSVIYGLSILEIIYVGPVSVSFFSTLLLVPEKKTKIIKTISFQNTH